MRQVARKVGEVRDAGRIWRWAYLFLMIVAAVALAILIWTQREQGQRITAQEAADQIENVGRVQDCYQSASTRPAVLALLHAIEGSIADNVTALETILKADLKVDVLLPIETKARRTQLQANKMRLRTVRDFIRLTEERTPVTLTRRDGEQRVPECEELAEQIGVDDSALRPGS